MLVTDLEEGLLGRLHHGMHMVSAVGLKLREAEAIQDAEDREREHALRGRCHVVERARGMRELQRRHFARHVAFEVGERKRAADRRKIGGN